MLYNVISGDFTILKNFKCDNSPPSPLVIREIICQPDNWVKWNTGGASNLGSSFCGGIF
jgi:hypothetical protein